MQNTEIAAMLDVHPVTLSRWRIGDRYPSRDMMLRIEHELGWPVEQQMDAFNRSVPENKTAYAVELKQFLKEVWDVPDPAEESSVEDA